MQVHVLRVFCDSSGNYGNAVGVVAEEGSKDRDARQRVATATGFSETVFIESVIERRIAIHNPQEEISFSGHAAVGVAWFFAHKLGEQIESLVGREGIIQAWTEDKLTWVRTELRATPPWWHERVSSVSELESLTGATANQDYVQMWAWADEEAGTVRSRTFAPAWGIPEDEANGSGCMRLAAALGRQLEIHHGEGSIIHARYPAPGFAEAGGAVAEAESLNID